MKNKINKTALTLALLAFLTSCSNSTTLKSETTDSLIKSEQKLDKQKSLTDLEKEILDKVEIPNNTEKLPTIEFDKVPEEKSFNQNSVTPTQTEEVEEKEEKKENLANNIETDLKGKTEVEDTIKSEETLDNGELSTILQIIGLIKEQEKNTTNKGTTTTIPTNPTPINPPSDIVDTPTTPDTDKHTHDYKWSMLDNSLEKGECKKCGKTETRNHSLEDWKYSETTDERHCNTCDYIETKVHVHANGPWKYTENNTDSRTCSTCGKVETRSHTHENSAWEYTGNNKDSRKCLTCGEVETRNHVHSDAPENLELKFKESKDNGTHILESSYNCNICNEKITNEVTENCKYGPKEIVKDLHLNEPYNQHEVKEICEVCGYVNKTNENCVKAGDLQCKKINNNIFEYYECSICNGYIDRKLHTDHKYNEWEISDDEHIRYCICVEAREEGPHDFKFDRESANSLNVVGATCDTCGYTKPLNPHPHAKDEMSLMDLLNYPFYGDLQSFSQIANPNPSPYDYCSRYDFRCSTCDSYYSIHYNHKFENGRCTRTGYCNGIEDPNYIVTEIPAVPPVEEAPTAPEETEVTITTPSEEINTGIQVTPTAPIEDSNNETQTEAIEETTELSEKEQLIVSLNSYKEELIALSQKEEKEAKRTLKNRQDKSR